MGIMTGVFHLVFGRRGPRTPPTPRSAPAPRPTAAPPPVAAPPQPAPTPAPVPPPPVTETPATPPPSEAPPVTAAPEQPAPPPEPPSTPAADAAAPPAAETAPPPAAEAPAPQATPDTPTAETRPAETPTTATEQQPTPAESTSSERPATETPASSETPSTPSEPAAQPESRPDIVIPAAGDPRRLTPHFRLDEFITTSTGLPNEPDAEEIERIRYSAERLEKVRTLLGGKPITINSCFRSRAVNDAVGGVENSAHRKGYAVDFTCQQFGTPYQIVEFLKQNTELMSEVDQLIFECSRWVHISFEPRNPVRKQVLTGYYQPGQGRKVFYLPDLHALRDDGYLPNAQV